MVNHAQSVTPAREATGQAPGKLILLGEHAVVYGYPALAIPLMALRCHATITVLPDEADGGLELVNASGVSLVPVSQPAPMGWEGPVALLNALRQTATGVQSALQVRIDSAIPVGAGLGSGAAVACAIARAWSALFGINDTEAALYDKIQIAERVAHGSPSGLDACTVLSEGPLLFDTHQGAQPIQVPCNGYWVIGHSGIQRQTVVAVKTVAQALQSEPQVTRATIARLGALAVDGARWLAGQDWRQLGAALDEAHALLGSLGVGHPRLNQLAEVARQHGALGAKLTGAGMGGCVLALADNTVTQQQVADAWRELGLPFVACLGEEGTSIL
jgi:mevalonate kinase